MVTFILLLSLNFFTDSCHVDSINGKNDSEIVYAIESWPEFEGDLKVFVQKNLKYPETATHDSITGKVYVQFLVKTNGETYNHLVIEGLNNELNKEALRVAKLIRFKNPAMQRGNPVEVKYTVPIEFNFINTEKTSKDSQ